MSIASADKSAWDFRHEGAVEATGIAEALHANISCIQLPETDGVSSTSRLGGSCKHESIKSQ
eukprot:scaffold69234_cov44-Prasinocladus_malaysianus.AAC.1